MDEQNCFFLFYNNFKKLNFEEHENIIEFALSIFKKTNVKYKIQELNDKKEDDDTKFKINVDLGFCKKEDDTTKFKTNVDLGFCKKEDDTTKFKNKPPL